MNSRGFFNDPWARPQHFRPQIPQWGGPPLGDIPHHFPRASYRPPISGPRGRSRGYSSAGRGNNFNCFRGNGNMKNAVQGMNNDFAVKSGKPSAPVSSKPAWLSQNTSLSSSVVKGESSCESNKSEKTDDTKNSGLDEKSLLSQSSSNNSNIDSKPAWLNTAVNVKPAWLNAATTTSQTTTTITSSVNTATAIQTQDNSVVHKPAWLTKSSGVKPILKPVSQQPTSLSQDVNDIDPPPPPPACPPPPNQPNWLSSNDLQQFQVHQQQSFQSVGAMSSSPSVVIPSKPKKKIKDEKDVQGTVALPGQKNFISYKNTLQEYCQKRGLSVPSYKSFKNSYGYSANVSLYTGQTISSTGVQKDRKVAEQFSAYEALKTLGVLSPQIPFVPITSSKLGAKRSMQSPQTVAKKLKNEFPAVVNGPNYKSQLNEFCQKFHLQVPTYETTNNGTGFVTTLTYNKKEYTSSLPQPTKRDAELNAAQVVLSKVNQAPPPNQNMGPVGYPNFVASNHLSFANATTAEPETSNEPPNSISIYSIQDISSHSTTPVISYKNKLQEVCQKERTNLPVYKTIKEAHLHSCELFVKGQTFNAKGCKTKKGAEQSAARVALEALGLL